MKITKRQLRKIISEAVSLQLINEDPSMLLEYEVYVDEKGYAHNDEGDSWYVGKGYGGETYAGTRAPWSSRRGRGSYRKPRPRKTSYVGADANAARIKAVEDAIAIKPNNFLDSILKQLKGGRGLSSKQNAIVRKILSRDPYNADATLFEGSRHRRARRM